MAHKLFVGSLSFSTSSEGLRTLFAEAGTVESATVLTDRNTGQSRGFAFVEMATAEEANAAVDRFDGHQLDGRQLKVHLDKPVDAGGGPRRTGTAGGRW